MLLTDYFRDTPDLTWDIALQCGVRHGTIRLPDDKTFDVTSAEQLRTIHERFQSRGITPLLLEPLPNVLHDHIKYGDQKRDECIEKFIVLMKNLHEIGITTVCFNFMAHYGWTRTSKNLLERGNAEVTGFSIQDFIPDTFQITHSQLWGNYTYFIKAVLPYARKYEIKLALHPDDPPLPTLGGTARIFTSLEAIQKGIHIEESPYLGVTFCQACYHLMGEDLDRAISSLSDKIFFIHFRNVRGVKSCFQETFHDNGDIDMAKAIQLYIQNGVDVPIRVDHVPTMAGEQSQIPGYDALGRMYAIGYLKGLLEGVQNNV